MNEPIEILPLLISLFDEATTEQVNSAIEYIGSLTSESEAMNFIQKIAEEKRLSFD